MQNRFFAATVTNNRGPTVAAARPERKRGDGGGSFCPVEGLRLVGWSLVCQPLDISFVASTALQSITVHCR